MKLDRNLPGARKGKYAVINCRRMGNDPPPMVVKLTPTGEKQFYLIPVEAVDFGPPESPDEFFVIRLKDRFALPALEAYATAAQAFDLEYAEEIFILAGRSGKRSQFCKDPD